MANDVTRKRLETLRDIPDVEQVEAEITARELALDALWFAERAFSYAADRPENTTERLVYRQFRKVVTRLTQLLTLAGTTDAEQLLWRLNTVLQATGDDDE